MSTNLTERTAASAASCAATRASSALELSEDGTKIRRAQPYVEVDAKELAARTVYVEPVADEDSIDAVQARFAPHGAVANVSLPRGRGFGAGCAAEAPAAPADVRHRLRAVAELAHAVHVRAGEQDT